MNLRRFAATLILAAAGCRGGAAKDVAAVEARLAEYQQLVLRMDHHGIAQLFASDGEVVNPGRDPIVGPAAVDSFLRGFDAYKVLEYSVVADSTVVQGRSAIQVGSYRQRVRVPAGDTVQVQGRFRAEWTNDGGGRWVIRRMGTTPR
jgi:ketosteroid isomerase-like protein